MTKEIEKEKKLELRIAVIAGSIAVMGSLLTYLLTIYHDKNVFERNLKIENAKQLYQKRLEMIERTSIITNKLPAINDHFNYYFEKTLSIDTMQNYHPGRAELVPKDLGLSEKLGEFKAELYTVIYLDQIYFGPNTRKYIEDKFVKLRNIDSAWWNLNRETTYIKLLETMSSELNYMPE